CGDLDAALLQVPLDLLLVLAAEAEAVRADHVVLGLDLVAEPGRVPRLVLGPHLPLARVVVEGVLTHHGDAVLGRAHRLAHAAAAARLHVGVVQAVGRHVEAGVRALDPAERALHALVEVDYRPHGARRVLLEVRIALRHVPLAAFHGLAHGNGGGGSPPPPLPPPWPAAGAPGVGVALADLSQPRAQPP